MDRRVAHTRTDGSSPRRNYSEIDMNSLRRISEALLLAQNRARLATERANRCERCVCLCIFVFLSVWMYL